ncbi:uncharacterized protein LOC143238822 [Tachypleus tridentatus]|uniref:uncharacterized protein LOC143238822 n=1 Tax=Tachypleus tridentatus TaxID=6853 RepID=UPI003FD3189B
MEILKIKAEPFPDEKQDVLLDIKLMKNEDVTPILPSNIETSVNTCCGSQFLGDHILRHEYILTEVSKCSKLDSYIYEKTNLNECNIKQSYIPQDGDEPYSYITCGREPVAVYNLKEHKRESIFSNQQCDPGAHYCNIYLEKNITHK